MSINVNITRQTTAKTSPCVKTVSKPSSGTSESAICGKATYKVSPTEGGERIGIVSFGSNVYIASYSKNSTPEDPIVLIGDNCEVKVNEVDPRNATELEMFALLTHMDKQGIAENNYSFGSFHKLRLDAQFAENYGFCTGISSPEYAFTTKRDWLEILQFTKSKYMETPIMYTQGLESEKLLFDFSKKWCTNKTQSDK